MSIREEKNMLENYPEIRDRSLLHRSWWEKLLWKRWYKGTGIALALAVPTAIVMTLTACTPKIDEAQQKAYQNYLTAWNQYQSAVNTYNKLENPDKPALSQNLVIEKTLDENATTQQLNDGSQTLQTATTQINKLINQYESANEAQERAYANYLAAFSAYEGVVAEYNTLEGVSALPANLVLSLTLGENASTQSLNDAAQTLQAATAQIETLIEGYETPTPTPPEPVIDYDKLTPKDLTEEQKQTILTKVTTALEKNIEKSIPTKEYEIVSMEFTTNSSNQGVARILFNYTTSNGEYYEMRDFPMNCELNYKNLLTSELSAADKYAGDRTIYFKVDTSEARASEVLAKLNPKLAESNPQFIGLTKTSGPVISIGGTSTITIYTINNNGIVKITTNARSDGDRTDPIGQSLLAESAVEGSDYTTPTIETFEFGNNAILLGSLFQEATETEMANIDVEIGGQRYAIVRELHTVYDKN